jgi:hypothetical protein
MDSGSEHIFREDVTPRVQSIQDACTQCPPQKQTWHLAASSGASAPTIAQTVPITCTRDECKVNGPSSAKNPADWTKT